MRQSPTQSPILSSFNVAKVSLSTLVVAFVAVTAPLGCSSGGGGSTGSGGTTGSGGMTSSGGQTGSGGAASGGTTGSGGKVGSGGTTGSGGSASGGSGTGTGGTGTGGDTGSGGSSTGGANAGGATSTGGATPTGGAAGGRGGQPGQGGTAAGGHGGRAVGSGGMGGAMPRDTGGAGVLPLDITLTSTALAEGAAFPANITCADSSMGSPDLTWTAGPSGTMSYAITLTDLTNGYVHWALWNIPSATMTLPAKLANTATLTTPAGAQQLSIMGGSYYGPCPGGSTHTYQFRVYALGAATLPGSMPTSTMNAKAAIVQNAIGSGTLTGTSNANKN